MPAINRRHDGFYIPVPKEGQTISVIFNNGENGDGEHTGPTRELVRKLLAQTPEQTVVSLYVALTNCTELIKLCTIGIIEEISLRA